MLCHPRWLSIFSVILLLLLAGHGQASGTNEADQSQTFFSYLVGSGTQPGLIRGPIFYILLGVGVVVSVFGFSLGSYRWAFVGVGGFIFVAVLRGLIDIGAVNGTGSATAAAKFPYFGMSATGTGTSIYSQDLKWASEWYPTIAYFAYTGCFYCERIITAAWQWMIIPGAVLIAGAVAYYRFAIANSLGALLPFIIGLICTVAFCLTPIVNFSAPTSTPTISPLFAIIDGSSASAAGRLGGRIPLAPALLFVGGYHLANFVVTAMQITGTEANAQLIAASRSARLDDEDIFLIRTMSGIGSTAFNEIIKAPERMRSEALKNDSPQVALLARIAPGYFPMHNSGETEADTPIGAGLFARDVPELRKVNGFSALNAYISNGPLNNLPIKGYINDAGSQRFWEGVKDIGIQGALIATPVVGQVARGGISVANVLRNGAAANVGSQIFLSRSAVNCDFRSMSGLYPGYEVRDLITNYLKPNVLQSASGTPGRISSVQREDQEAIIEPWRTDYQRGAFPESLSTAPGALVTIYVPVFSSRDRGSIHFYPDLLTPGAPILPATYESTAIGGTPIDTQVSLGAAIRDNLGAVVSSSSNLSPGAVHPGGNKSVALGGNVSALTFTPVDISSLVRAVILRKYLDPVANDLRQVTGIDASGVTQTVPVVVRLSRRCQGAMTLLSQGVSNNPDLWACLCANSYGIALTSGEITATNVAARLQDIFNTQYRNRLADASGLSSAYTTPTLPGDPGTDIASRSSMDLIFAARGIKEQAKLVPASLDSSGVASPSLDQSSGDTWSFSGFTKAAVEWLAQNALYLLGLFAQALTYLIDGVWRYLIGIVILLFLLVSPVIFGAMLIPGKWTGIIGFGQAVLFISLWPVATAIGKSFMSIASDIEITTEFGVTSGAGATASVMKLLGASMVFMSPVVASALMDVSGRGLQSLGGTVVSTSFAVVGSAATMITSALGAVAMLAASGVGRVLGGVAATVQAGGKGVADAAKDVGDKAGSAATTAQRAIADQSRRWGDMAQSGVALAVQGTSQALQGAGAVMGDAGKVVQGAGSGLQTGTQMGNQASDLVLKDRTWMMGGSTSATGRAIMASSNRLGDHQKLAQVKEREATVAEGKAKELSSQGRDTEAGVFRAQAAAARGMEAQYHGVTGNTVKAAKAAHSAAQNAHSAFQAKAISDNDYAAYSSLAHQLLGTEAHAAVSVGDRPRAIAAHTAMTDFMEQRASGHRVLAEAHNEERRNRASELGYREKPGEPGVFTSGAIDAAESQKREQKATGDRLAASMSSVAGFSRPFTSITDYSAAAKEAAGLTLSDTQQAQMDNWKGAYESYIGADKDHGSALKTMEEHLERDHRYRAASTLYGQEMQRVAEYQTQGDRVARVALSELAPSLQVPATAGEAHNSREDLLTGFAQASIASSGTSVDAGKRRVEVRQAAVQAMSQLHGFAAGADNPDDADRFRLQADLIAATVNHVSTGDGFIVADGSIGQSGDTAVTFDTVAETYAGRGGEAGRIGAQVRAAIQSAGGYGNMQGLMTSAAFTAMMGSATKLGIARNDVAAARGDSVLTRFAQKS